MTRRRPMNKGCTPAHFNLNVVHEAPDPNRFKGAAAAAQAWSKKHPNPLAPNRKKHDHHKETN